MSCVAVFFVCSSKPSKSSKSSKSSLDLGGFDVSDGFDDFDDHMAFYGSRRMSETETPYHVDDKVVLSITSIANNAIKRLIPFLPFAQAFSKSLTGTV